MKKLLAILAVLVVIAGGYFFFKNINSKSGSNTASSNSQVTIKLLPFPLVVANDGSKNDSLLELALNKENKIIDIQDGYLEFDNVFPFGKKVSFSGVYINFSYDSKNNKVNFSGYTNTAIATNISGEYYLNDKNNIVYNLNFNSDKYNLIISGNYKFLEDQDGVLEGSFTFNTNDIIQLLNSSTGSFYQKIGVNINKAKSLTVNGDYSYQDNQYNINNAVIKSDDFDAVTNVNFSNEDNTILNMDLSINYLNLDEIMSNFQLNDTNLDILKTYFLGYLQSFIEMYNGKNVFTGKITGTQVTLNNANINNVALDISSQTNPGLSLSKFNFTFPGESVFSTSGVIDANQFRPEYNGNITLNTQDFKTLAEYFDKNIGAVSLIENMQLTANSKITATPMLTALYGINVLGNGGTILGRWLYSDYNIQKIVHSDFNVSNFNIKFLDILQEHPLNNLIKKSNDQDFSNQILSLKTVKLIYDSDLQFNNVTFNNKVFDQINFEVLLRPEIAQLSGIKVKSDSLKFNGYIVMDASGVGPVLDVALQGDKFDPDFLRYLIYVESKSGGAGDNAEDNGNNGILRIFRFDKFTGYIQLSFNNLQNAVFSASNFNFSASLKDAAMQIKKFTANVFGGSLQVAGSMSFAPFNSSLSYSLTDANVSNITSMLFNNNDFTGNLSLVGSATASGQTVNEISNHLNGAIELQSNAFVANNFNINSFVAMYGKSAIGKGTDLRSGSTSFSSLSGDVTIDKGIFSSDKISFETSDSVNGAASFNFGLSDCLMNNITSFAYVDPEGSIDGFNISLKGPIDNLKMQLGSGSNGNGQAQ